MAKSKPNKTLYVTQIGSKIGCTKSQVLSLRGLGLGKIGKTVKVEDNSCIKGMIRKVAHIVEIGDSNE